jgi:hypothetical protein
MPAPMRLAGIAGFLVLAAAANAAVPNIKEGLWEITVRMEIQGMPSMPPQTMQQCITQKDISDPRMMAPRDSKDSQCEVTEHKMQANSATWTMVCRGEHAMSGSGSFTFSGTSYTGTSRMSMKQGGDTINMTVNYSGKHIGPCR